MTGRNRTCRRVLGRGAGLVALVASFGTLVIGSSLAEGSASHHAASKPGVSLGKPILTPRPQPLAQPVAGQTGVPAAGSAPPVNRTTVAPSVRGTKPGAAGQRPAPALLRKAGTVIRRLAPGGTSGGRAEVNGQVRLGARHAGAGPLLVPAPSSAHPATAKGFTPTGFYSSTQLDNFSLSQNESGTHAASAPAISRPPKMSRQIAAQSITK